MMNFEPLLTRLYQCTKISDHVLARVDLHPWYKHRLARRGNEVSISVFSDVTCDGL
jgi:hypothetical protein